MNSRKWTWFIINGISIPLYNENHPASINWQETQPDFVIESTGKFKTKSELQHHLTNGAKQVVLSVPALDDDIKTIVIGVNDNTIEGSETIISNASCTTNNAAPMIEIINDLLVTVAIVCSPLRAYNYIFLISNNS